MACWRRIIDISMNQYNFGGKNRTTWGKAICEDKVFNVKENDTNPS